MGGHTTARPDRRPRRLAALAASIVVGAALSLVAPSPSRAASGLDFVGMWPHDADEAAFVVDETAEHIYVVRNFDAFPGTSVRFEIKAYRPDGTQVGTVHQEPLAVVGAPTAQGSPAVWWLDAPGRTLYLVAYPAVPGRTADLRNHAVAPRLMAFDVSNPAAITKRWEKVITAFPAEVRILGLSLDDGRLYAVAQSDPAVLRAFSVWVAELDITGPAIVPAFPPVPVRSCQRVISGKQPAGIVASGGAVFIGCAPTADATATNPIGITSSVQEVNLRDPSASRSYFLPGTYVKGESFVDPNAGDAGRMVLVGSAALRPGQAVWVFDLAHRAVISQVAAPTIEGAGVDPNTGHVFVASPQALRVASDRGFPVPGAMPPEWDFPAGHDVQRTVSGRVITATFGDDHLVFVPVDTQSSSKDRYAIFRDTVTDDDLPPGSPTEWEPLDDEIVGSDTPSYTGSAQAFGFRIHQLGGAGNARSNLDGSDPTWWNQPIWSAPGAGDDFKVDSPAKITGVDDGDRDVKFSRVFDATLSADEAAAIASTADADERTRADHVSLTKKFKNMQEGNIDPREPDLVGEGEGIDGDAWPFGDARCGRFRPGPTGGGSETAASENAAAWTTSPPATVTCDLDRNRVVAEASFQGLGDLGPVKVGTSAVTTRLERDDAGGVVVVAEAEARDIEIGDVIRLGRVSSRAEASAFGGHLDVDGRLLAAGANHASYTTEFEHVELPGFSCPENCDPEAVQRELAEALAQLTDVVGGQVRVELPAAEIVETPQGAHAHAWREPWQMRQDVLLNGQVPDDTEIPALRIMVVTDADLPSRTILEFAATRADATHRRVQDVPPDPDFEDPDEDNDEDAPTHDTTDSGPTLVAGTDPVTRTVTVAGRKAAQTAAATPAAASTGSQSFLEQITQGAKWLFGRALPVFLLTAAVWALFGVPPFLAARRRHLMRLARAPGRR